MAQGKTQSVPDGSTRIGTVRSLLDRLAPVASWLARPGVRRVARALLWLPVAVGAFLAWRPNPGEALSSGSDKFDHLSGFAAMAWLAVVGHGAYRRWPSAGALLGYGVLIELVQLVVPGRSAELLDVLADACGIGLGLLLAAPVSLQREKVS